jgi:hypothetical protein
VQSWQKKSKDICMTRNTFGIDGCAFHHSLTMCFCFRCPEGKFGNKKKKMQIYQQKLQLKRTYFANLVDAGKLKIFTLFLSSSNIHSTMRISLEKELQESNKMLDEVCLPRTLLMFHLTRQLWTQLFSFGPVECIYSCQLLSFDGTQITASISMDDFIDKEDEDKKETVCNEVEDSPPENDDRREENVARDSKPSAHVEDGKEEEVMETTDATSSGARETSGNVLTAKDDVDEPTPPEEEEKSGSGSGSGSVSEIHEEECAINVDSQDDAEMDSSVMDVRKEKEMEMSVTPDISKITQFIQKIWHSSSKEKRTSGPQTSIMGRIEHMLEEKSRETERFVVQLGDEFQSAMNATVYAQQIFQKGRPQNTHTQKQSE